MRAIARIGPVILISMLFAPRVPAGEDREHRGHNRKNPSPMAALATPLLDEGFEVSMPPAGWSTYKMDGAVGDWGRDADTYYSCYGKYQAAKFAYTGDPTGGTSWLVTPQITIPAAGAELTFYDNAYDYVWKVTEPYYDAVLVTTSSSSDPSTATYVEILKIQGHSTCKKYTLDLNAYAGKKVFIAFRYAVDGKHWWLMDNVKVTPRTMFAKFAGASILDDLCGGAGGSHNKFIDPGESITVDVLVKNVGAVNLTDATATLTSTTSGVTITNGSVAYPTLTPGEVKGANDPKLSFTVAGSVACGTPLDLKIKLTSGGESADSYFTFDVYQNPNPIDERFNDCGWYGCSWPWGWSLQHVSGYPWTPDNFEIACTTDADDGAFTVGGTATDSWLFTSAVPMMPGVVYTLSFKERTESGGSHKLTILAGPNAENSDMTISIMPETSFTNTACETITKTFTVPTAGDYYIGFHEECAEDSQTFYVDDILLTASLDCHECKPDTTAPAVSITSGPTGIINSSTANFTWSGSDNGTPAAYLKYSYYLQGKEAGYGAWSTLTSAVYTGLADGSYTLWVKAKDEAGNESAPASQTFYVDTTKPTASITEGPSGTINVSTAKFSWTGSDAKTPVGSLKYAYYLAGKEAGYGAWTSSTTYTYTGLASKSYTFYVKSKDEAGNESNAANRDFTVSAVTYSISGRVHRADNGSISGVTVSAGGLTAKTGSSGEYLISGLAAGSYTVTAGLSGYTFGPGSRSVTISDKNVAWIDFMAVSATDTLLTSGSSKSGSVGSGLWANYYIPVPGRATQLKVTVTGLTGDVLLRTSLGGRASTNYTHSESDAAGVADEVITDTNPAPGIWGISVKGKAAASYSIKATVTLGGSTTHLLGNRTFDRGTNRGGWMEYSSDPSGFGHVIAVPMNLPVAPKSASFDAQLCATGADGYSNMFDRLSQGVWIPANISSAKLTFWRYIKTDETGALAKDTLKVKVAETTLQTLSNLDKTAAWTKSSTLDLSSYKGKLVLIAFEGQSNSSLPTWFLIDDVDIEVTE